jgi:hypothetical protein
MEKRITVYKIRFNHLPCEIVRMYPDKYSLDSTFSSMMPTLSEAAVKVWCCFFYCYGEHLIHMCFFQDFFVHFFSATTIFFTFHFAFESDTSLERKLVTEELPVSEKVIK